MYGTQVASSRWQRLVRDTMCDSHWNVLTIMPCVAYSEKEDSLVLLHGDDCLDQGVAGQTAGREGVLLHKRIR